MCRNLLQLSCSDSSYNMLSSSTTLQMSLFISSLVLFISSLLSSSGEAVVIDSALLSVVSGPLLLGLGTYGTFGYKALTTYLHHKPRRTKVYHVMPFEHPDGKITTSVHADISKPFHYDYLKSPLPHRPLMPQHLKSPVERYSGLEISSSIQSLPSYKYRHLISKTHLYSRLPPVVSPPYLPFPLLYPSHHTFSSPYW